MYLIAIARGLCGTRLGRPKNYPEVVAVEKRQCIDDQRQRNAVEGKNGQGKRRFRLNLIREKLPATGFDHCNECSGDEPREGAGASFYSFCVLDPASALKSARSSFTFCASE